MVCVKHTIICVLHRPLLSRPEVRRLIIGGEDQRRVNVAEDVVETRKWRSHVYLEAVEGRVRPDDQAFVVLQRVDVSQRRQHGAKTPGLWRQTQETASSVQKMAAAAAAAVVSPTFCICLEPVGQPRNNIFT